MLARRAAVVVVLAMGAVTSVVAFGPNAEATGYVICPASTTVVTWDGSANDSGEAVGDGMSWDDAWNWDLDCIPGEQDPDTPDNDVAVIPKGAVVTLTGDQIFPALGSLQNRGTLIMTTGSELDLLNSSTSRITEMHGWIHGVGTLAITKRMDWDSLSGGAATMSTRACLSTPPCDTSAPPVPGVTTVRPGAVLNVNGLGVNLSDRRVIKNYGSVVLSGAGYIAAGYGTTFRNIDNTPANAAIPLFEFANDLGYYQGHALPGETLGVFQNSGVVRKTAGTGTSVIDASYFKTDPASPSTGTVEVKSGSLALLAPNFTGAVEAQVDQGSGFANASPGDCATDGDPSDCALQVDAGDPQAMELDLTDPTAGTVPVTLHELPNAANPGGFGVPVEVDSPGAVATNADPMELRLYVDATLLGSATPNQVAKKAKIQRQGQPGDPYSSLPRCALVGGSTPTQACVDRAASATETSAAGGDVVIVVQTQQNSRYRVGRIPVAN
jgi:hypothetical protein